jgi:hypothetical protein
MFIQLLINDVLVKPRHAPRSRHSAILTDEQVQKSKECARVWVVSIKRSPRQKCDDHGDSWDLLPQRQPLAPFLLTSKVECIFFVLQ